MKIQITRNDIYQMVNEAVQKITEQMDELNNAAQRIAVVRNIYAKHHLKDPNFTWEDAVDWYIQNYQSHLEGGEDNFTVEDMREELMNYAQNMEREREAKNNRGNEMLSKHQKNFNIMNEILSKLGGQLSVKKRDEGTRFEEAYFTVEFETIPFDFNNIPVDYFTSISSRCLDALNQIQAAGIEHLGYPQHSGLNIFTPGSDGQSRIGLGNDHFIGIITDASEAGDVAEKMTMGYKWEEFGPSIKTITARLKASLNGIGTARLTLYFEGEFDEAGHDMINKHVDMALASVEHDRDMGWSLD